MAMVRYPRGVNQFSKPKLAAISSRLGVVQDHLFLASSFLLLIRSHLFVHSCMVLHSFQGYSASYIALLQLAILSTDHNRTIGQSSSVSRSSAALLNAL